MRKIFVSVLTLKPNEIRVLAHPLAWLKVSMGMELHTRERRRVAVHSPLGPGTCQACLQSSPGKALKTKPSDGDLVPGQR